MTRTVWPVIRKIIDHVFNNSVEFDTRSTLRLIIDLMVAGIIATIVVVSPVVFAYEVWRI